jgi:hypothetical protein
MKQDSIFFDTVTNKSRPHSHAFNFKFSAPDPEVVMLLGGPLFQLAQQRPATTNIKLIFPASNK